MDSLYFYDFKAHDLSKSSAFHWKQFKTATVMLGNCIPKHDFVSVMNTNSSLLWRMLFPQNWDDCDHAGDNSRDQVPI